MRRRPASPARILLAAAFLASTPAAARDVVDPGRFSAGSLAGWETKSFKGQTRYALVRDPERRGTVLQATSEAAASGLFRRVKVDLTKTPYLNWSWKVTGTYPGIDEAAKQGDDFPARIYVVVERGIGGMSSIALNYVWASRRGTGAMWASPYTRQVRLLAVNSGEQGLGDWVRHKRDLRADLRRAFGEDVAEIDAVAIMTDSDDARGRATAFYGDISFTAD
jgi:hypothetical protein